MGFYAGARDSLSSAQYGRDSVGLRWPWSIAIAMSGFSSGA
jgi:hypothetical protein